MKLNKFFMLGLAGLAFAACSNDDEIVSQGQKGDNTVVLSLSLGKTEMSRAAETSAAGLFNNLLSLDIQFYGADGRRVVVDRTVEEQAAYENSLKVAIEALEDRQNTSQGEQTKVTQVTLTGVPVTATQILVIANQNTPVNTNSLELARESQIRLKGLVEKANDKCVFNQQNSLMTGFAGIGEANAEGVAKASVSITPVSSRLEVQKVTAMKCETEGAVDLNSFTLKGIYVNRFYTKGALDPEKNSAERVKVDNRDEPLNYTKEKYESITANGETDFEFMCDVIGTEGTTSTTTDAIAEVACADGKYWGYPILARAQNTAVDGVYDVPNLVVEMEIKYNHPETGIETIATKYLTIVGYHTTDGTPISTFERRHVYRINDLQFDFEDLADVPYQGTKSIEATVTVLPWIGVDVQPDFN